MFTKDVFTENVPSTSEISKSTENVHSEWNAELCMPQLADRTSMATTTALHIASHVHQACHFSREEEIVIVGVGCVLFCPPVGDHAAAA